MGKYLELMEEKKDIESRSGSLIWADKILSERPVDGDEELVISIKQAGGNMWTVMTGADLSSHKQILDVLVKEEAKRRLTRLSEINELLSAAESTLSELMLQSSR